MGYRFSSTAALLEITYQSFIERSRWSEVAFVSGKQPERSVEIQASERANDCFL